VWLPVALKVYLDETGDYDILNEDVVGAESGVALTVSERVSSAMDWLLQARDKRLSYIAQGDWCDPMNMVGYKGRGVSGWLTVATAYALNLWAEICETTGASSSLAESAKHFRAGARAVNRAANEHLWDGDWFARGITDDDVVFGTSDEGRPHLAQPAGLGHPRRRRQRRPARLDGAGREQQLCTPYGVQMFAPPYSAMRDDVGRVTQKHPGSAENGAATTTPPCSTSTACTPSAKATAPTSCCARCCPARARPITCSAASCRCSSPTTIAAHGASIRARPAVPASCSTPAPCRGLPVLHRRPVA
jgi:cellobionic acid phosphorylase